ncbi:MAG TPA: hypothetical protein VG734_07055 [Lacunisphaera sp.]|nr:hypothetical protein [Lacunisphaera sp.]
MSPAPSARVACILLSLPALLLAQTPAPASRPEIPLPVISTPMGRLPGVNDLPARPALPDILVMNDGTKVTSAAQWPARRAEIRRTLEYYATGQMPPAPGNVKGTEVKAESVAAGKVKYRLVHLTFGPGEKLELNLGLFTPAEGGPFPVIILQGGTPPGATPLPRLPPGPNQGKGENVLLFVGPAPAPAAPPASGTEMASAPATPANAAASGAVPGANARNAPVTAEAMAERYADIFRRGYALAVFNPNDCAEDTTLREQDGTFSFRTTRFFPAYPGYDWGILAGWAWGASRAADYLQTDAAIDHTKLMVITGASRNGKSAMVAAAFDERLMGAPVVTGGGGVGAYRFAGPRRSETLDVMELKYPNWFSPELRQFRGQREKLPFDQHWFLALCAPRPFLALEGDTDTISLPEAVRRSILAAEPVYQLLGAPGRLGVHYSHHGHAFNGEDWTALMNFTDRHLLGKRDFTFDWFPTEAELDAAAKRGN